MQNKNKSSRYQLLIISAVIFYANVTQQAFASQSQANFDIIKKEAARKLRKDPNNLTDEDLTKITELQLSRGELRDLKYLEKFTNLQRLDIQNIRFPKSEITNGTVTSGSTNPQEKQAFDLSPLEKLPNLTFLCISNMPVRNIEPLVSLKNLQVLALLCNVSDLEPLKELKNLNHLTLSQNKPIDLEFIKDYKNLQKLIIPNTPISNIEPIKGLTSLLELSILNTKVSDIGPLRGLVNLQNLNLYKTQVSDLRPITNLTQITTLVLSESKVTNLEPVSGLVNLRTLQMNKTEVLNVSPLKELKNLRSLAMVETKVTDIGPLHGLVNLDLIDIRGTKISDLSPLMGMTNLRTARIDATKITDLKPLESIPNLREVIFQNYDHITEGQITDLRNSSQSLLVEFETSNGISGSRTPRPLF